MIGHGPQLSWSPGHPDFEARLNAYLDRELSPADAAEFERLVHSDASLRAELDASRALEIDLRRAFSPPE